MTRNLPKEVFGISVKPSLRAKRFSLRLDLRARKIILIWPQKGREVDAQRFIQQQRVWIGQRNAEIKKEKVILPGAQIQIQGNIYTLRHNPERGLTRFDGEYLIIHGNIEHFQRRLRDFLRKYAYMVLRGLTLQKMQQLTLPVRQIRIMDPKTRWGSCSANGQIMLSWRLILAPFEVMDYVVSHEVAHRIHMNHSRQFWSLCIQLSVNAKDAKRWLRTHGAKLHAVLP